MTTSGGTTHFHYNGDKVVYETNGSNAIVAEYTYDPEGNPLTMTRSGVTYYYHINGHGDVVNLTDGSGNVVATYDYDAYGNIISQSGTMASVNPYRYAGYRYDEATGLYYLMARYYDANVGRFITRDSFHGFVNEPRSLNNYVYCNNDPINRIDPSGNYSWTLNSNKMSLLSDIMGALSSRWYWIAGSAGAAAMTTTKLIAYLAITGMGAAVAAKVAVFLKGAGLILGGVALYFQTLSSLFAVYAHYTTTVITMSSAAPWTGGLINLKGSKKGLNDRSDKRYMPPIVSYIAYANINGL